MFKKTKFKNLNSASFIALKLSLNKIQHTQSKCNSLDHLSILNDKLCDKVEM